MLPSLWEPPLLGRLRGHDRILIAGAGGGFDVYAGLPLYMALRAAGKQAFLANLTFTYFGETDAPLLGPHLRVVTPVTTGADRYFPERHLAEWLASEGHPSTVYAFEKVGVQPLRAAYRRLVRHLSTSAIVLVDGGTDILMRGDEAGLGTPEEDMASLAAVAGLDARDGSEGSIEGFVASIGFGVDAYHGVCHTQVLESIAALERDGGYLGAFAVTAAMAEGRAYLAAVSRAQSLTARRPSIVNGSIAAAVEGQFGDVRFTERTANSELFVNPLMSIYFGFELGALARRSLYLPALEDTHTIFEVSARIEAFRNTITPRPRVPFPH
jgi:hypothetical protein